MTLRKTTSFALGLACLAGLAAPRPARAQIFKKAKEAAKHAVEDQTAQEIDQLIRSAVHCAFDDFECIQGAQDSGQQVVLTDEDGNVLKDDDGRPIQKQEDLPPDKKERAQKARVDTGDSAFEPGERTILQTDFASAATGDFPRELEFIKGSMSVVHLDGRPFLRAESGVDRFAVALPDTLPERFTLEFEVLDQNASGVNVAFTEPDDFSWAWAHGYDKAFLSAGNSHGSGLYAGDRARRPGAVSVTPNTRAEEEVVPVGVTVDGKHVKMYMGGRRVADVPSADLGRSDHVYFFLRPHAASGDYVYVGDIRVAAGGHDLYTALSDEGRVAVHDILFDTDEATIKPASAETLQKIAAMLEAHPDLRLLIQGHTDDRGSFDHNMKLSGDRAAAVKAYLVDRLGIDADRLRTMGLGSTQPVASNDTEEGRARNRRVELVKMGGGS